jgi:hypothetical protein
MPPFQSQNRPWEILSNTRRISDSAGGRRVAFVWFCHRSPGHGETLTDHEGRLIQEGKLAQVGEISFLRSRKGNRSKIGRPSCHAGTHPFSSFQGAAWRHDDCSENPPWWEVRKARKPSALLLGGSSRERARVRPEDSRRLALCRLGLSPDPNAG